MKLPPLPALKAFEATARHLSFSRAADELFVTHTAVSHQIRKLEEWFGNRLFARKGRGIELTRSGEILFRGISPAFSDIAETCSRVKALGVRETLTVGCIPSIASRWLVPNLNQFTTRYPDLDVRVVYAAAEERLAARDLHVLITAGTETTQDVSTIKLFSRASRPVCSPTFLETHGPFDTSDKIASVPLLHDERREDWRSWFDAAGIVWTGDDNWPVYADFNMLATAVIAGHGIALCPTDVFRLEIDRGDLVVLSDLAIKSDTAYFASVKEPATGAAMEFIEWFAGFLKK